MAVSPVRRACALLLLLLAAPLPVASAQAEEPPFRVEPAQGDLATRFRFEGPAHLFGEERLADRAFASVPFSWVPESEVGAPPRVRVEDGVALLSAGPAEGPGTVFLRQDVRPAPGWHELRVGARLAEGEAFRGLLLLRQRDDAGAERDDVVPFPLGRAREEVRVPFEVAEGTALLSVHLRYELAKGQRATVAFDAPSLRPAPRMSWAFEDGAVNGSVVERTFARPGDHEARFFVEGAPAGARVVPVVNRAPVPNVRLVLKEGAWLLDGRESFDPDAPQHLRNAAFAEGATGWTLDTPEVAGDATMQALRDEGRDVLRVSTGAAHPSGSVWAYQELSGVPKGPLDFRVDVRDSGDHAGYAVVLRELGPDARDTVITADPSRGWQTLSARWTPLPTATALFVQLRFLVDADQPTTVDFANATLAPALRHAWTVEGRAAGTEPVVPWPAGPEGPRSVRLEVTDHLGSKANVSTTLEALPPPPTEGSPLGPRLVLAGEPARWSLADVRFPAMELLRNGDFERGVAGWGFDASEVGGRANASMEPGRGGRVVRVDFNASTNGTFFLVQDVPVRNGTQYDFSVVRRDAGLDHYAFLVREHGFNQTRHRTPQAWVDDLWILPSTSDWEAAARRWKPTYPDSTHVAVYVRGSAKEGQAGTAWFDNVSFAPARAVQWTLDGRPLTTGLDLPLPGLAPGSHLLEATVRSGGKAVDVSIPVHALNASHAVLHPDLEGGVRAQWRFPADAPVREVVLSQGANRTSVRALEGVHVFEAPPANGTYALEAVTPEGQRLVVANGTLRAGAFAELLAMTPARPTRGDEATLWARALDPRIERLEAVVDGDVVPMRLLPNGTWEGTWRVPRLRVGEAADVVFRAADARGREGRVDAAALPVEPFAGGARPLPWLALLAGATALAFAAPLLPGVTRWRRGG